MNQAIKEAREASRPRPAFSVNAMTLPVLVTPREAAAVLRVSVGHLANDRSKFRKIPYHKVGAKVLYRMDDLLKIIETGRHGVEAVA